MMILSWQYQTSEAFWNAGIQRCQIRVRMCGYQHIFLPFFPVHACPRCHSFQGQPCNNQLLSWLSKFLRGCKAGEQQPHLPPTSWLAFATAQLYQKRTIHSITAPS